MIVCLVLLLFVDASFVAVQLFVVDAGLDSDAAIYLVYLLYVVDADFLCCSVPA